MKLDISDVTGNYKSYPRTKRFILRIDNFEPMGDVKMMSFIVKGSVVDEGFEVYTKNSTMHEISTCVMERSCPDFFGNRFISLYSSASLPRTF